MTWGEDKSKLKQESMTRDQLISLSKPVELSSDDVSALLDIINSTSSQIIRPITTAVTGLNDLLPSSAQPTEDHVDDLAVWNFFYKTKVDGIYREKSIAIPSPYKKGDYLYACEPWAYGSFISNDENNRSDSSLFEETDPADIDSRKTAQFYFRSDFLEDEKNSIRWNPADKMPKDASRLFMKIDDISPILTVDGWLWEIVCRDFWLAEPPLEVNPDYKK